MTVLRLALSELKRMTSGRLPRLSILALTLVPMLYGAVYLYANWDPYGRLNQLKAADGAEQLRDGVAQLGSGSSELAQGARQLVAGTGRLSAGLDQMAQQTAGLSTATTRLADGAQQLAGGLQQAAAGATQLADGSARLSEGVIELADQLRHGAGQIPNPDEAAKVNASKVIGDPVAVSSVAQTKAGSYGAGLAPFFLVLALWVGAFMLVQAMRPLTQRALASNASTWIGGIRWLAAVLHRIHRPGTSALPGGALRPRLEPLPPLADLRATVAGLNGLHRANPGHRGASGHPGQVRSVDPAGAPVGLLGWHLSLADYPRTFAYHAYDPADGVRRGGMRHLIYGASLDPLPAIVLALLGYTVFGLLLSVLAVRRHKFWTLKTLQPEIAI